MKIFSYLLKGMPPKLTQIQKVFPKGFTILELLVAVSVTALLAAMLLNITSQVVSTQTQASGDLETNQIAQFILDRVQEDLQCALSRNDGNVWMAAKILNDEANSGQWKVAKVNTNKKPVEESKRLFKDDWPTASQDPLMEANGQGPLLDSRFGVAGTWLRFFTQSSELDPSIKNNGGPRAVSYQIVRFGLTASPTSRARYQLFRADVNTDNTFKAGYNLHPEDGGYNLSGSNGPREPQNILNPIFQASNGESPTGFSLASNIIDFGIRAYIIDKNSKGTGFLKQIFPRLDLSNHDYEYFATSHPSTNYQADSNQKFLNAFPEVVDVMIRILTTEGESAISALEEGLTPIPAGYNPGEYWWEIAEKYSEVYVRRIKVFSSSI